MKRVNNKYYIEYIDVFFFALVAFLLMWLFTSCTPKRTIVSTKRMELYYFKETKYNVGDSIIQDTVIIHRKHN
jgi:hypothetical protein